MITRKREMTFPRKVCSHSPQFCTIDIILLSPTSLPYLPLKAVTKIYRQVQNLSSASSLFYLLSLICISFCLSQFSLLLLVSQPKPAVCGLPFGFWSLLASWTMSLPHQLQNMSKREVLNLMVSFSQCTNHSSSLNSVRSLQSGQSLSVIHRRTIQIGCQCLLQYLYSA